MLNGPKIRNAKPREKLYRLHDALGLYLEVPPSGRPRWRFKFRVGGREKRLSVGCHPEVSLKEARARRDDLRRMLRDGKDPASERRNAKDDRKDKAANTFAVVAEEWRDKWAVGKSPSTTGRVWSRIERFVIPHLGRRPIAEIDAPEVLAVLQRIEHRGTGDTAHRVKQSLAQIFRHGITTGRIKSDPTRDLKEALKAVSGSNFPAVTEPERVGELLRMLDAHNGEPAVSAALRVAPYLLARPGELRTMRWADVDTEAQEWRFKGSKKGGERIVPLAPQVVEIIEALRPLTGKSEFVFRSLRGDRPISDAALTAALRRLGIAREEHTMHGWRATARTLLHERLGWEPDIVEHQLGHKVPDRLGAAYNRTRFIEERRRMMMQWATYLDTLKAGDQKVVPMHRRPA